MANPKPPSDVPEFGKIGPDKTSAPKPGITPDTEKFESYMKETPPPSAQPQQISPMELARQQQTAISPTVDSLNNQVTNSQNNLNDIQNKLNTPKLALKNSHQRLLDTKLSEANNNMQKASQHLGGNAITPSQIPKDASPVEKFLGYVNDGQNQLLEAKQKLTDLSQRKSTLSAPDMLLVQVNLAQAQQKLEFSSVLLSKVVDSLKQIFNIQL